jgi:hypothetical protein
VPQTTKIPFAKFGRCKMCYIEIFAGGGADMKFPKNVKSVGFVSGAQKCRAHKIKQECYVRNTKVKGWNTVTYNFLIVLT